MILYWMMSCYSKPIYAPKVNKEFTGGLHENFVNQKLAEKQHLEKDR